MKKWMVLFYLLCIGLPVVYAHQAGEDIFRLVKKDAIISLYERWIPAASGEQVREIKAVFSVKADVDGVTRLLTNQRQGTVWNTNAKEYQVLQWENTDNWITYTKYGIPWPFGDQDCCLLYHLYKQPQHTRAGEITFESTLHNRFPVSGSITRITGTRGKWLMEDEGNGAMRITYIISTNRSKKIPRWVSDPIVRNNLFATMTTFRNILEKQSL
ncbi:START domain-containing protein [Chitinophaga nivalis]|uniref:START domain-containing protein n=1 Tax=Chitinophaga nivalis TaxID=2991709 RepID=A0ABT3IGP2_9BACT|nr:START domain-containing protein [Chitinophaga nivalis]MCW3467188.1 START domain-containing protein [Chitinophaga nivalis]MCW3483120.1 START domain-containing protein [Chitinophaga nivalis]